MNQLPSIVINTILNDLSPDFKYFYEKRKGTPYYRDEYEDFVKGVISVNIGNALSKEELQKAGFETSRSIRRYKKRWLESLLTNIEQFQGQKAAKQYPFKDLYQQYQLMSKQQWDMLYNGKSYDEVEEDEVKKAIEWAKDEDSFLIAFPGISAFTPKRVVSALEVDIFYSAYNILKNKFGLEIEKIMYPYVDEMADAPFFANSRKQQKLTEDAENPVLFIDMAEDGTERLELSIKDMSLTEGMLKAFDEKDRTLLSAIIRRAANTSDTSNLYLMDIRGLASEVYGIKNPSAKHYDETEQRCYKLANYTYNHFVDGKQAGAVNFVDSAIPKDIGKSRYMEIVLGRVLYEPILEKRLKMIPNENIEKIENNTAKIMILALQKERVRISKLFKAGKIETCSTEYDYNRLLSMVNFSARSKKANLRDAKEAFLDFKAKEVYVKDIQFNSVKSTFVVEFFPLSEDEERDLEIWGFNQELIEE